MSFAAEGWAWEQVAPSSAAKAVLVCLAWYADRLGSDAYPSMATLCRRTQQVERTVRKALKELSAAGLIERERRFAPNQRCISTMYRLILRETTPANMQGHNGRATPANPQPFGNPTPANMPEVFGVGEEPQPRSKSSRTPAKEQENLYLEPSKKEEPLLRNGEPALPVAVEATPKWTPSWMEEAPPAASKVPTVTTEGDVRRQLFSEGKLILRRTTGHLASEAGAVIIKLLKVADKDCAVVLACLRDVEREGVPGDGVMGWVINAIRNRKDLRFRDPAVELAHKRGLLTPEARERSRATLTWDHTAFEKEAAHG
jgi:hypothetical protein